MKLFKSILFLALVLFQFTSKASSVLDANGQVYFRTIPKKSIVNLIDYTPAISGNNLKTWLNTLDEIADDALLLDLYSSIKTLSPSQITRLNNAILKTDGTINNALSELIVKLSEGGTNALSRLAKGVGDIVYRSDFIEHLTDVKGFTQKRAVTGGHNLDNFNNYLSSNNIQINRISTSNGSVDGISELTYQIQKADGSGGWKSTQFKKTHYDPSKISDTQMTDFGKEAMTEGLQANRTVIQQGSNTIIKGESSNGIKFLGYQDPTTGEILNFHPVLNY